MITQLSHPETPAHRGRQPARPAHASAGWPRSWPRPPAACWPRPPPPRPPSRSLIPSGTEALAPSAPVPATVRVITTGGMAGWQIALIALGAALVAAAAAVLLDRTLAGRRGATATTA